MLVCSKVVSAAALSLGLWSAVAMAHPDAAHVQAEGAWARASVLGQQATGGFVRLTAQEPLKLVGVETPAAEFGEVHEMKMDGDVMRMRPLESLDLPQGQTVELKPGGLHLMFQQLKAPLLEGTQVPVTLVFENAQGTASRLHLQMPVQRLAPRVGMPQHVTHPAHAEPVVHGNGH